MTKGYGVKVKEKDKVKSKIKNEVKDLVVNDKV